MRFGNPAFNMGSDGEGLVIGGGVESIPFLRGIYYTGKDFIGGDQWPVQDASEYYLVKKKMNSVRLGIKWEAIQPTLNGALDATFLAGVDQQVQWVTGRGGWLFLDLHAYGRRTVSGVDYVIGESAGVVTAAHLADLWGKLAARYKGNRRVVFELMNEPHDLDGATWAATQSACWQAIKAQGVDRGRVVFTANCWNMTGFGNDQKVCLNALATALGFKPLIALHHYFDFGSPGSGPSVTPGYMDAVTAVTAWFRANGFQCACTEYGAGLDPASLSALAAFLAHIEGNRDVYKGHMNLGGGGWWSPTFWSRLDPIAQLFSWPSTVYDMPQMEVIQAYLPGASAYNGDPVPNAFAFTDVTGATVSTDYVSDEITIGGINAWTFASVSGGLMSINGGGYTSAQQMVQSGDKIKLKVTSSGNGSTAVNATLNVGGVSDTYTVTTAAAPVYAVWNSADKTANVTLSNSDKTAAAATSTAPWPQVRSSIGATTGKKFFSVVPTTNPNSSWQIGIVKSTVSLGAANLGQTGTSIEIDGAGNIWNGSSVLVAFGAIPAAAAVDFAIDLDAKKLWVRINGGNWNNSGTANPATGVGGLSFDFGTGATIHAGVTAYGVTLTANFGASAYSYAAPSGFGNF